MRIPRPTFDADVWMRILDGRKNTAIADTKTNPLTISESLMEKEGGNPDTTQGRSLEITWTRCGHIDLASISSALDKWIGNWISPKQSCARRDFSLGNILETTEKSQMRNATPRPRRHARTTAPSKLAIPAASPMRGRQANGNEDAAPTRLRQGRC